VNESPPRRQSRRTRPDISDSRLYPRRNWPHRDARTRLNPADPRAACRFSVPGVGSDYHNNHVQHAARRRREVARPPDAVAEMPRPNRNRPQPSPSRRWDCPPAAPSTRENPSEPLAVLAKKSVVPTPSRRRPTARRDENCHEVRRAHEVAQAADPGGLSRSTRLSRTAPAVETRDVASVPALYLKTVDVVPT
jgi:hypothetical protein